MASIAAKEAGIESGVASGAQKHVRELTRASGTSFFWAMRLLPAARRDAMFAIYAFCREIDDIADEDAPPKDKVRRLDDWRAEIERVYDGNPTLTTSHALARAIDQFGLERDDFLALIEGMEMDAREAICAPSMKQLEYYCDRVACAVGRLSIKAFGAKEAAAKDVAFSLGQALQVTNILRDPKEDAARGRLYLPRELLEKHGIAERGPDAVLYHPKLPLVCNDLAIVAQGRFEEADAALAECDRRPMRPAIVMKEIYSHYLDRLVAGGWQDLEHRVSLPPLQKLWIGLRYGLI